MRRLESNARRKLVMPIILICLILTYTGLGVFAWQRHRKCGNRVCPLKAELAVLGMALLVYRATLLMPALWNNVLIMGFGYSISLIIWLMLMIYYLGGFFYCLHGLQLLLYSCTTVTLLLGQVLPDKFVGYQINDLLLMLYTASPPLAYGLFGIIALFTVLILLLNRNLHRQRASALLSFLPPLLSLEKLMFCGMLTGFVLLTHSVVGDASFVEGVFSKPLTFTHRTMFDILSRLIYGGPLLRHSMTAWRGKKAAVWAIIDFVSLLLVCVGSKFVLEVVLHWQGRRDGEVVRRA